MPGPLLFLEIDNGSNVFGSQAMSDYVLGGVPGAAAYSVAGSGTLSAGAATVSNTAVKSTSKIVVQRTSTTLLNSGDIAVTSKTAGTGFTVNSSNILDGATFDYVILG